MIRIRRVYSPPGADEGDRYLVDRLWPRGVKKQDLQIDGWLREIAPSEALRRWFGHDPSRWEGFLARYYSELDGKQEALRPIREAMRLGDVTLLYAARDEDHNNAVALAAYLEEPRETEDG